MAPTPKTSRREVPLEKRARILDRYRQGKSVPQIASSLGLPRSTVHSIIDRYKDYKNPGFKNKPRLRRPLELSPKAERRLLRHAVTHTKDTLFALTTL